MRKKGEDTFTLVAFYRSLVKAVLQFRAETWVLSLAMERDSGVPQGFLWQVTGKGARRQKYGTWWREGEDIFLKTTRTQDI